MSEKETYCRLCAEPTPDEQLIKSEDDVAISSNVEKKMLWINIDVSSSNYLPKTICFSCFDLLEKTWGFLHNVRTAQQTLNDIYSNKLELPPECEIKPVNKLNDAGKPVDANWDDFQTKSEVKIEVPLESVDEIISVDPNSLLNYTEWNKVKKESMDRDYCDNSLQFSTDSDQPLLQIRSKVNRKKKKKKKKIIMEEEIDADDLLPNATAEAINLDMSLCSASWDDYTWVCAHCDAQCKSISLLRLHSLEIHSCCCIFKCCDCEKVVTNYKTFLSHVRIHRSPLRYCCEVCNKNFSMIRSLKKHRNLMHSDDFLCFCQNCGALFESSDELQNHILNYAKGYRRQLKKKEEKYEQELKCEHCSKEFKTLSNLRVHKVVHMERSRDFSCHVCGKMFFTKGALSTHMTTHDDTKKYKCEFCQMAFRARGNLNSHISLHSGAKPFVCEQCGKSFRVKRHLKSHSIVHTDLMPFICEYCNKPFRFKTRLNLHLRQHTGWKPYTCVYCHRDFTNGSNYKKHMKRRHNVDTSKRKFMQKLSDPNLIDISDNNAQ